MVDSHLNNVTSHNAPGSGPDRSGHEPNTLSLTAVGLCVLVLVVLIVGAQPIVAWLYQTAGGEQHLSVSLSSFDPGSARNWNHPEADLAALRKEEDKHLTEYAWLDRERGFVRIPITEAMRLLADERGATQRRDPAPSPDDTTRGLRNESE